MRQINFLEELPYEDKRSGVSLLITLSYQGNEINVPAKVDTGADVCLFNHETGLALGIPIERGDYLRLGGLTGTLEAYGHEVTIQTGSIAFQSVVYFAKYPGLQRNLLGRQGWLRNLKLGLMDYDNRLHLSPYDAA
ncbi:MAG: retropepsin-like aspartic protease [Blastocatellia bacterium]